MAEDKKRSYPKIARSNWFLLRDKFKQRTPEKVTPSYIATALSMGEASASANIIPPLRAFELIDDSGKPTDLAYDWRDDNKYPEVCKKIFERIYPSEIRDLIHSPDGKLSDVSNWFARDAKVGKAAAGQYASTYMLLLEADPVQAKAANGTKQKATSSPQRAVKTTKTKSEKERIQRPATIDAAGSRNNDQQDARGFSPKLHVDIQIHISPDSSPEQIDKIFESMAKHLPLKS